VKPVLFVTNHVAPSRVGALAALAERVPLEVVTFGGRLRHGGTPAQAATIAERDVFGLAASGRWSAVVCGTAGRVALPAAFAGARRAHAPFVLWASLWAHPRTAAHVLGYVPTLAIYRGADAVVTYGEHVSAYVAARGARRVFVAPQSVDNTFWSEPSGAPSEEFRALFVGRDAPEKGLAVLRAAWPGGGTLEVVTGGRTAAELRNFYARSHVLVMPSLRTRDFREPWGLAANEAMNQRTAIIATDQVGAAAGGLVRHKRNGLVVGAGDATALAAAIVALRDDAALRDRLAAAGARDVGAFTHAAWASGFEAALREVGAC
jgi:glycosyltransferase involved in cell wall biosynthesis